MFEYNDFRIQFHPETETGFPVHVSSSQGDARGSFLPPFELKLANKLVRDLKSRLSEPSSEKQSHHIGESLFEALFVGDIAALFNRTLAVAESKSDQGVRVRLQMDIDDPGLAQLSALPWELLADHNRREFVSLKSRSQVVRYVEVSRPANITVVEKPFRILVAFANPRGTFSIDDRLVSEEKALFENSLAHRDDVDVTVIERASMASVRQALSQSAFHAFHYLGHGSFMRGAGEGSLNFESDSGDRSLNQVEGPQLGVLLEGFPSLQLIVLNACKSAQATVKDKQDPFFGVAPALVMSGIPAVIAMQYIISVEAAVAFSGGFYPELTQTGFVDLAVAEGRKQIYQANNRDVEWATPVLFMRSSDGKLFDVAASRTAPETASPAAPKREVDTSTSIESSASSTDLPAPVYAIIVKALSLLDDPAIRAGYTDLVSSISTNFPDSRVLRALAKLEDRPDSNARASVLEEELSESSVSEHPAVVDAASKLHQSLEETGNDLSGIELNVSGDKNIFSGTGDVNIGGDLNMGDD